MINKLAYMSQSSNGAYFKHKTNLLIDSFIIQNKMNLGEHFNEKKKIKEMMEQMRFKEKIQNINKKKDNYKRSTNNCHKKYIGILKNLLFLKLTDDIKNKILSDYNQFKNSRVYYFIILCYVKWYLAINQIRWIFQHFCKQVEDKIRRYQLEIQTTNNQNFIHFRRDQIIQMEYSIHSINHFLRGNIEQSIKMLYQKNKYIIIKRNQYLKTTKIVDELEKQLKQKFNIHTMKEKLDNLQLEAIYTWKIQNNFQRKINKNECFYQQSNNGEIYHYQSLNQQKRSSNSLKNSEDISKNIENKHVKIQENQQYQQINHQMPLIGLQNSYPVANELNWFNWIASKQKQMQMYMRFKQESMMRFYAANRINIPGQSSFTFPSV